MLVLKKISTKKITIYISIIALMLAGTGFMLYQNQTPKNTDPMIIGGLPRQAYPPAVGADVPAGAAQPEPLAGAQNINLNPIQTSQANAVNNSQGLDLTIFSSEKFKGLKPNDLIFQESVNLGKRDPFRPD